MEAPRRRSTPAQRRAKTNTDLTYFIARKHIDELLREAEHAHRAGQLRRKRRLVVALPRIRFSRRLTATV
jgi:hypothetical protein